MAVKEKINKIKGETKQIENEIREKTIGYIVAAFGLVAGLAWNEAIKAMIEQLFPLDKNSLLAKFIYAILISLVVVVVSMYLLRVARRSEEEK